MKYRIFENNFLMTLIFEVLSDFELYKYAWAFPFKILQVLDKYV